MGKIMIICSQSIDDLGLFDDIKTDNRYLYRIAYVKYYSGKSLKSFIFRILESICLSPVINRIIDIPMKYIWHSYYISKSQLKDIDLILVMNGAVRFIDYNFFNYFKKHNKKLKICLYLIDSLHSQSPALLTSLNKLFQYKWDDIITYDPSDAKEKGFKYLGFSYFSKSSKYDANIIQADSKSKEYVPRVFLAAGLKGNRKDLIIETYKHLYNNQVNYDFVISTQGEEFSNIPYGMEMNSFYISYKDVLKRTLKSDCIIEILQENQHGTSIRYFEAVCYNKKQLTNNPNIVEYPFYDDRYMKVFQSPDEIDIQWLKDETMPEYHYNNEFSPKFLKTRLEKLLDL